MLTRRIFMVRPARFGFNEETSESNVFQEEPVQDPFLVQKKALDEFDEFVEKIRAAGIEVDVLADDPEIEKPDAIYPNNWMSTHQGGIMVTYPMYAPVRRRERSVKHLEVIKEKYEMTTLLSLELFETFHLFLEGTGSMVLDHEYRIAYACRSVRTDAIPFYRFCQLMDFSPVMFDSVDGNGIPYYHTNIMMALGPRFVVINRSSIGDADWQILKDLFDKTQKEIIEISHDQTSAFLGNIICLKNAEDRPCIVMSGSAEAALEPSQRKRLNKHGQLIVCDISTIEQVGGGSARCMIAENYFRPLE